jgi:hypothetical protein
MKKLNEIDKDKFELLLWENTIQKVADMFSCSKWEVSKLKRKHGIKSSQLTKRRIKYEIEKDNEFKLVKIIKHDGPRSQIIIKHLKCNRNLETVYKYYKDPRRNKCGFCAGTKLDKKSIVKKVKELEGTNYKFKDEYKHGELQELKRFWHKDCNSNFYMRPSDFLYNGYRCNNCNKHAYTKKELKEIIKKIDNEYEVIYIPENFKGISRTNIKIKHLECGTVMDIRPNNFITNGQRCPTCTENPIHNLLGDSKGIIKIKEFLKDGNLNFETEKTFNDLKSEFSNKKLRFDIFVSKLNLLIEYDGKYHMRQKENTIFTEDRINRVQIHDKKKNKYCKENNINLLRIPHTDFKNIEIILENYIQRLSFSVNSQQE